MSSSSSSSHTIEGQSSTRPPYFDGSNYGYWKSRMKIYLKGQEFGIWKIIEKGYKESTTDYDEWKTEEKATFALNYKAMNALICALSSEEFNRVSTLKTAKEMWDTLEVTHEGTNQVKKTKINLLLSDLESFRMKKDETVSSMYTRFTYIINELKGLGKIFPNEDLVNKILRSLPKS
ncbi:uncharacterized protein LOC143889967 [Tasmannia lanceolata]|uniref:uncharacterized protein LOC143889967 n=1 Tax=Tasmannia lanceolata TaxID=3420 RepID=UPI00406316BF